MRERERERENERERERKRERERERASIKEEERSRTAVKHKSLIFAASRGAAANSSKSENGFLFGQKNCRFFPASAFANLNFEHQLDSGPGDGSRNNTDSEAKSVTAPPGRKNPK